MTSTAYEGVPYSPLPTAADDPFFARGNSPKSCCLSWSISLFRCLLAPLGWLKCAAVAVAQCFCWTCPRTTLWDVVLYLLR